MNMKVPPLCLFELSQDVGKIGNLEEYSKPRLRRLEESEIEELASNSHGSYKMC